MSTQVIEKTVTKVTKPPFYKVILVNDDITSFSYVMMILMNVFHHEYENAEKIMLTVHENGSDVAGIFPHEIAEMKIQEVQRLNMASGENLQVKIESE